jgi:hypothetical protein
MARGRPAHRDLQRGRGFTVDETADLFARHGLILPWLAEEIGVSQMHVSRLLRHALE